MNCNHCEAAVEGSGYRTACHHFFCISCAQAIMEHIKIDATNQIVLECPCCNFSQLKQQFQEVAVGIQVNANINHLLYQFILQDTSNYDAVIKNMKLVSQAMNDVQSFTLSQLLLVEQRGAHDYNLLNEKQQEISRLSGEINDISVKCNNMDLILRQAERKTVEDTKELNELKEAYKEKHRKCLAWEKAYNSIRDQLGGARPANANVPRNHDGNVIGEQVGNSQLTNQKEPFEYNYKQNYAQTENKGNAPHYPQQVQHTYPQSYLDVPYMNQNTYRDRPLTPNATALPLPSPSSYNTDGQKHRYDPQRQVATYSDTTHRSSHMPPLQVPTGNYAYTHNRDIGISNLPLALQHSPPSNKTLKRMEITTITNTKHVNPTSNIIQEYNHMEVNHHKRSNNWVTNKSYVATNKYQKKSGDASASIDLNRQPRNQDSVELTNVDSQRMKSSKRFFDTQEQPKITW